MYGTPATRSKVGTNNLMKMKKKILLKKNLLIWEFCLSLRDLRFRIYEKIVKLGPYMKYHFFFLVNRKFIGPW